MFDLTRRQWAWWLALIFWVVAFIFSPVLPEGDLQWITKIVENMQLVAAVIVAVFYGSPNKPKEKPSDDKEIGK